MIMMRACRGYLPRDHHICESPAGLTLAGSLVCPARCRASRSPPRPRPTPPSPPPNMLSCRVCDASCLSCVVSSCRCFIRCHVATSSSRHIVMTSVVVCHVSSVMCHAALLAQFARVRAAPARAPGPTARGGLILVPDEPRLPRPPPPPQPVPDAVAEGESRALSQSPLPPRGQFSSVQPRQMGIALWELRTLQGCLEVWDKQ